MLHELLIRAADETPNSPAVVCGGETVTYAALDELAAGIAVELRARGVRRGDRVGLWLDKSVVAVAAMQAALRLGAAYVPIDPGSPPARVERILASCEPVVTLTTGKRQRALSDAKAAARCLAVDCAEDREGNRTGWPSRGEIAESTPSDVDALAYVLFTSGSTGDPKGVAISHRNALAFIHWAAGEVGATRADLFANHAPFHFDLSVFDLYVAFSVGACVSLIPSGMAGAPGRLVEFLRDQSITVWYSVPSILCMMMDHGELLGSGTNPPRVVIFAGEPFPVGRLRELRDAWRTSRMFNFYGPTETNVCTAHEVVAGGIESSRTRPVPIGRAASGNRVWLEGEGGSEPTDGAIGEVIVSGPTVMLGYFGREPQSGRDYRTGDLAFRNSEGDLELVGRRDDMLKVRGHRIEPGEVENVLVLHPRIAEAVVTVRGVGCDARLVAALTGPEEGRPGLLEIKRLCARHLPRSMIIDRARWLPDLPRTPNGKVDRCRVGSLLDDTQENPQTRTLAGTS